MSHPIESPCPKCGAVIGQNCQGKRGDRKSFHRERGSRRNTVPIEEVDGELTDSPIEHTLLSAITEWLVSNPAPETVVETQVKIGPYRADIWIHTEGRILIVEADGAQWHNTEEAIARDKRRDRYCASQGWFVMRFTGAEINRDPRGCAAEVGNWIRRRE